MIRFNFNSKCFTTEWINQKSIELKYNDKNLIEKVIRVFSLLEMLAASGCPFCFKGGSCLMLIFADQPHRLSIDVDIMCPPGTNIEDYLKDYAQRGFIDYQLVERRQAGKDVPKSHSKFFYQVAFKGPSNATSFILLDVLYEDEALLVVDKPAGLIVHPTFHRQTGTLANRVLAH